MAPGYPVPGATAPPWLLHDAIVLRSMHGVALRGERLVCRRCGAAYSWPCSRWLRANAVICSVRAVGVARVR